MSLMYGDSLRFTTAKWGLILDGGLRCQEIIVNRKSGHILYIAVANIDVGYIDQVAAKCFINDDLAGLLCEIHPSVYIKGNGKLFDQLVKLLIAVAAIVVGRPGLEYLIQEPLRVTCGQGLRLRSNVGLRLHSLRHLSQHS